MTTDALSSDPQTTASVTGAARGGTSLLEQAVVLQDVGWDQYVVLRDNPANRGLRMTYREGMLEIMTLGALHELVSSLIDHFILEWRVARNIPVRPSGSMTLRRQALERGWELFHVAECLR